MTENFEPVVCVRRPKVQDRPHLRVVAVFAVLVSLLSMMATAPSAEAATPTAPGAPTAVTGVGFDRSAVVWFTAPVSNGGYAVTAYTVTATDGTTPANGGQTCTATDANRGCTVTGLTNADSYTFRVTATNAVGTGSASSASGAVVPAVVTAVQIAIGPTADSTCARLSNGTVNCWGQNASGQLGDGTTTSRSVPVQVQGVGGVGLLTGVTSIGAGQHHACAVLTLGGLACWGRNSNGQLGDGTIVNRSTPVTVVDRVLGPMGTTTSTKVSSVVGRFFGTCAVLVDGGAVCWGLNTSGQVGDNTTTNRLYPRTVTGVGGSGSLSGVASLSSGGNFACALLIAGGVDCWGDNKGNLGDNTITSRFSPVQVKGVGGSGTLSGASAIATSQVTSCALISGGVSCWGKSGLGDGLDVERFTPGSVAAVGGSGTLSGVSSIASGAGYTCAVLTAGGVDCWGTNNSGRLGTGGAGTLSASTPAQVKAIGGSGTLAGVSAVAAGSNHTCALLVAGGVNCWGTASGMQVGDGTTTQRNSPVAVIASAPTSVSVISKASRRATVSWTGSTGAIAYTVTATDTTTAGNGGQTCLTGSTSCTITGLTNGDNYTFAVTAYNGFLTSAASVSSGSTAIAGTPEAPTSLVATPLATAASISFTAGSNGGSAITKYQYSTDTGSTWNDVAAGGTTSPAYISGLATSTKYAIALRAVNATGAGEASAAVSVTPMAQSLALQSIPGLQALDVDLDARVNSVSCVSDGNCSAGGSFKNGSRYAFVAREVAGVWQTATQVAFLHTSDGTFDAEVLSVSCTSSGNCSAGGYYTELGSWERRAFVVSQIDGVWQTAIEVPGLAVLNVMGWASVDSVSCASAGNCAAGGVYTSLSNAMPFVVSQVDGVWAAAIEVPGMSQSPGGTYMGETKSVSCPSAGNCVAGGWTDGSAAFVVSQIEGVWQNLESVPGLSGINEGSAYEVQVQSVSCSSVGNCAAVGNFSRGTYVGYDFSNYHLPQSFVVSQLAGVWQTAVAVTQPVLPDMTYSALQSVSCPSDGNCSAVGYSNTSHALVDDGEGPYDGFNFAEMAISQVAGTWQSSTAISGLSGVDGQSISCSSAGNCSAGGVGFVVAQSNGIWKGQVSITGSSRGVSCPATNCTFVGSTGSGGFVGVLGNTIPAAPTGLTVASVARTSVSIAFVPGDSGVGGAITKYQYQIASGSWTDVNSGGTSSPSTITGLTNGTAVSVRLRAYDANGGGIASDAISVTPYTLPSAPTIGTATPTASGTTITFTSAATGGDAITGYEYSTSTDSYNTWASAIGTVSPVTINGLIDGGLYSIKLRAVNRAGSGSASGAASVTPRSMAWMPTSLVATAGDGSASIAFTNPGSDGGAAITNYKYQLDEGSWVALSPTDTTSPVTIPGLTNGTTYSVRLAAVNAAGDGYFSDAVSVTPVVSYTAPDAPTSLIATPGNGSVSIAFVAGATGGDAISKYQYQIGSGSWADVSSGGTSSPSSITGLTNGTSYSIKLRAYNGAGGGTESLSVSVNPYTTPSAPTSLVATTANGSVSIAFVAGATGGKAIGKYQYQIGSGAWLDAPAGTSSPVVITGLVNYVTYSIKLRACSDAGGGTGSSPASVTAKINGPVITNAYSGNISGIAARGIIVAFNGVTSPGATMVSYRINAYVKGTNTLVSTVLMRASDRAAFLGGLTKGVEYDIRVVGYLTLAGSPLLTRGTYESATRTARV